MLGDYAAKVFHNAFLYICYVDLNWKSYGLFLLFYILRVSPCHRQFGREMGVREMGTSPAY
jgi:hypothetical protein